MAVCVFWLWVLDVYSWTEQSEKAGSVSTATQCLRTIHKGTLLWFYILKVCDFYFWRFNSCSDLRQFSYPIYIPAMGALNTTQMSFIPHPHPHHLLRRVNDWPGRFSLRNLNLGHVDLVSQLQGDKLEGFINSGAEATTWNEEASLQRIERPAKERKEKKRGLGVKRER